MELIKIWITMVALMLIPAGNGFCTDTSANNFAWNDYYSRLVGKLGKEHSRETRMEAIESLKTIFGDINGTIPVLAILANDPDQSVSDLAIDALREVGPLAVPILVNAFGDNDGDNCYDYATALGFIGKEAIPALVQGHANGNDLVRVGSAYALGVMGGKAKSAVPALISIIDDISVHVRATVIVSLAQIKDDAKTIVPLLIKALYDSDDGVRLVATRAIAVFGKDAVDALPRLRELAANDPYLSGIDDAEPTYMIREAAADSIEAIQNSI